jgi:hypothetical protein
MNGANTSSQYGTKGKKKREEQKLIPVAWPGTYETMGYGTSTTEPGARINPSSWTDLDRVFWIFGGLGYNSSTFGIYRFVSFS